MHPIVAVPVPVPIAVPTQVVVIRDASLRSTIAILSTAFWITSRKIALIVHGHIALACRSLRLILITGAEPFMTA